jgi:hypothetical protein
MVLASSLMLLVGTASAHGTVKPAGTEGTGNCTVVSLPSFVAQGEFDNAATVGDVIEVSCDPFTYGTGSEVTVTAAQLFSRCHEVTWYNPNNDGEVTESSGPSVKLFLDADGNANVGLIAGPDCAPGESLVTLDENESPYETFTTSFSVLPPVNTPQGVVTLPSSQVEDSNSSAVVTIVEAEFKGASESRVRLASEQLYDRCEKDVGVEWVREDRSTHDGAEVTDTEGNEAIELDNNGNGFALAIGSDSCAEGVSLVEADLLSNPFTTETTTFTVESPRPRIGA